MLGLSPTFPLVDPLNFQPGFPSLHNAFLHSTILHLDPLSAAITSSTHHQPQLSPLSPLPPSLPTLSLRHPLRESFSPRVLGSLGSTSPQHPLVHSRGSPLHKAHEDDRQAGRFLEHARSRVTSRRLFHCPLPAGPCPATATAAPTNEGEIFIVSNSLSPCIFTGPARLATRISDPLIAPFDQFSLALFFSIISVPSPSPSTLLSHPSLVCTCPGLVTPEKKTRREV